MAKKSTNIEESVLVKNEGGFSLPNRRVNVTMIPKNTPLVTSLLRSMDPTCRF